MSSITPIYKVVYIVQISDGGRLLLSADSHKGYTLVASFDSPSLAHSRAIQTVKPGQQYRILAVTIPRAETPRA